MTADCFIETIKLVAKYPGITGQEIAKELGPNSWVNRMLVYSGILWAGKTDKVNVLKYDINFAEIKWCKNLLRLPARKVPERRAKRVLELAQKAGLI